MAGRGIPLGFWSFDIPYSFDFKDWDVDKTLEIINSWAKNNNAIIESIKKPNEIMLVHGKLSSPLVSSKDYRKRMRFVLSKVDQSTHVKVIITPIHPTYETRPNKLTIINYWWLLNEIWSDAGDKDATRRIEKVKLMHIEQRKKDFHYSRVALLLGLIMAVIAMPFSLWLVGSGQYFQGDWLYQKGFTAEATLVLLISLSLILIIGGICGLIYDHFKIKKLTESLQSQ